MDEKKLGQLLLVKDVITKRQLASAVQSQIKGDNRKIGEILIDKGFLTMEDLTDILLENGHSEPTPVIPTPEPSGLVEGSELSKNTKFKVSIQTMISAGVGIATLVGFWYALQADIQEAKELSEVGIKELNIIATTLQPFFARFNPLAKKKVINPTTIINIPKITNMLAPINASNGTFAIIVDIVPAPINMKIPKSKETTAPA